jgi:hypothetical protein
MQTHKSEAVPPLQVEPALELYPVRGRVVGARAFADEHLSIVAPNEQAILRQCRRWLSAVAPPELPAPMVRSGLPRVDGKSLPAIRRGARSAFVPHLGLKLKGCRPEPATFPSWKIDEQRRVKVVDIPFGVLQADGVVRELLGYCFATCHGLATPTIPVAVLEYGDVNGDGRFCLVSRGEDGERAEARIDCDRVTVHGLLRLHRAGHLCGREAGLAGFDTIRFVRRKSHALIAMHFAGGRRGVLNSNIGNDVLSDGTFAGLCDFDTFHVEPLPRPDDAEGIGRFVFTAWLEVLKGSLPIIDYCDDGSGRALAACYRRHSSLFAIYREEFMRAAAKVDWDTTVVEAAIADTLESPIATELLRELVPNADTMARFTADAWYVPHN